MEEDTAPVSPAPPAAAAAAAKAGPQRGKQQADMNDAIATSMAAAGVMRVRGRGRRESGEESDSTILMWKLLHFHLLVYTCTAQVIV